MQRTEEELKELLAYASHIAVVYHSKLNNCLPEDERRSVAASTLAEVLRKNEGLSQVGINRLLGRAIRNRLCDELRKSPTWQRGTDYKSHRVGVNVPEDVLLFEGISDPGLAPDQALVEKESCANRQRIYRLLTECPDLTAREREYCAAYMKGTTDKRLWEEHGISSPRAYQLRLSIKRKLQLRVSRLLKA